MIHDSITLLDDSQIQRVRGDGNKGTSFPVDPEIGQSWELTEAFDDYVAGLYVWSVLDKWVHVVEVEKNPYDVALSAFGRPRVTDTFIRFAVPRTMLIEDIAQSVAYAGTAPTLEFVFNVRAQNPSTLEETRIGTITFQPGSRVGVFASETGAALMERGSVLLLGIDSEFADETLSDFTATIAGRYYY